MPKNTLTATWKQESKKSNPNQKAEELSKM